MARVRDPIWLARPSRFAAISAVRARGVLAVALLLMALCALEPGWRSAPALPEPARSQSEGADSDLALYDTITDGVRHGGDYYELTARERRSRPGYPLRPFVTFRLPLLATVQAALPPPVTLALLFALAGAVVLAWSARIAQALPERASRTIAGLLLAAGLFTFVQPALVASHEIWAALLIALSLALRRPDRWIEAVAIAIVAMLTRETAALYVIVMAALAWWEGRTREALAWAFALLVLAAVMAAHACAVWQVTGPLDMVSDGWSGMNGFRFFVMTIRHATALDVFPYLVAVPVVVLAMLGWASWDSPVALRMTATIAGYAAVIGLFARLDDLHWGLIIAPVLLLGLAFAPDGMRDLVMAARDTRRITVKRVVR